MDQTKLKQLSENNLELYNALLQHEKLYQQRLAMFIEISNNPLKHAGLMKILKNNNTTNENINKVYANFLNLPVKK